MTRGLMFGQESDWYQARLGSWLNPPEPFGIVLIKPEGRELASGQALGSGGGGRRLGAGQMRIGAGVSGGSGSIVKPVDETCNLHLIRPLVPTRPEHLAPIIEVCIFPA